MTGYTTALQMFMQMTLCQLRVTRRLFGGLFVPRSLPGLPPVPRKNRSHERFLPVSKAKQVESEVWLLRLGTPGVRQLDMLPGRVTGIPTAFRYHPFHYIDHKEHASVKKRPAQFSAVRTLECKCHFYMDFEIGRAHV